MRRLLSVFALSLYGCVQIGTGTEGGGTSSGTGGQASSSGSSGSGDAGPAGSGCSEDPETQIVLCQAIDTCPNVAVDPGAYPNCGFRVGGGSALDLECICPGALCPIGIPTSCDQAQQLLSSQSSVTVCLQENEGRCVPLPGAGATEAGSSSPCAACAAQCGGTPACFQACGC